MTEAVPRPNDEQRINNPGDRLESWKEIAAYLNRGVRTAQRWERTEGLPVHRHHHDKRGTVYAFRHEIETWRANRKPDSTAASGGDPLPSAGQDRGGFGSILKRMSNNLRRLIPADLKKRVPVRLTTWILPT